MHEHSNSAFSAQRLEGGIAVSVIGGRGPSAGIREEHLSYLRADLGTALQAPREAAGHREMGADRGDLSRHGQTIESVTLEPTGTTVPTAG